MQNCSTKPEVGVFDTAASLQLLQSFLRSIMEIEEVWGLGDNTGWVLRDHDDGSVSLPVWPTREHACEMAVGEWQDQESVAVSLDHFIENILDKLKDSGYMIEISPTASEKGVLLAAKKFSEMLEGMIDAGEYYMEG